MRGRRSELRDAVDGRTEMRFEATMQVLQPLREGIELLGHIGQRHRMREPACGGGELGGPLPQDPGGALLHELAR